MAITLTLSQQRAIAIAPIPASAITIFSSLLVAIHVLKSRDRRSMGYHRIIVAISINLILYGSALCFGSTPVPRTIRPPIYGAMGSYMTCEIQGFTQYLTRFIATLYYCTLPYVIWSRLLSHFEETRKTRQVEWIVNIVCTMIPFAFALIALQRKYIR